MTGGVPIDGVQPSVLGEMPLAPFEPVAPVMLWTLPMPVVRVVGDGEPAVGRGGGAEQLVIGDATGGGTVDGCADIVDAGEPGVVV